MPQNPKPRFNLQPEEKPYYVSVEINVMATSPEEAIHVAKALLPEYGTFTLERISNGVGEAYSAVYDDAGEYED